MPENLVLMPARFAAMRAALGLTQTQFAVALGRSLRSVRNFETGERPVPRVVRLAAMALLQGLPDPADAPDCWKPQKSTISAAELDTAPSDAGALM